MNEYGLDSHYFKKNLKILVRDVERHTPDEMFNALTRLAGVAGHQAGLSVTTKVKFVKQPCGSVEE